MTCISKQVYHHLPKNRKTFKLKIIIDNLIISYGFKTFLTIRIIIIGEFDTDNVNIILNQKQIMFFLNIMLHSNIM